MCFHCNKLQWSVLQSIEAECFLRVTWAALLFLCKHQATASCTEPDLDHLQSEWVSFLHLRVTFCDKCLSVEQEKNFQSYTASLLSWTSAFKQGSSLKYLKATPMVGTSRLAALLAVSHYGGTYCTSDDSPRWGSPDLSCECHSAVPTVPGGFRTWGWDRVADGQHASLGFMSARSDMESGKKAMQFLFAFALFWREDE